MYKSSPTEGTVVWLVLGGVYHFVLVLPSIDMQVDYWWFGWGLYYIVRYREILNQHFMLPVKYSTESLESSVPTVFPSIMQDSLAQ